MNETAIKDYVLRLCEALYNKKATNIIAIPVADKTIVADWFILASGRAVPQIKALSDELEDKAAEWGLPLRRKEGYPEGRWIVLDFADILVHIFHPEERRCYNLERLWETDAATILYSEQKDAETAQ